uniref:Uncharacterized protein n=1 Tax=Ditylenchus dipsaci TaxID=166011 RepID=A0A915EF65_9BILA
MFIGSLYYPLSCFALKIMDEIFAMQGKKEELQWRVVQEVAKAKEYCKKVDHITKRLNDTKEKNAALLTSASQSFQLVELLQFKLSTLENTLKEKDEFVSVINSLCQHESPRSNDLKKLEIMVQDFQKQCTSAPWLVHKSQYLTELEGVCNQLGILNRDIKVIDNKIVERKKIVESHQEMTFLKFCIHLANYKRSMAGIRKLLDREMKLNNDYKEKLSKRNSSDVEFMDISMMSDYVARNMTSTTHPNVTSEVNNFSIFNQSDRPRNESDSIAEPFDMEFNAPSLFNKNIFGF